MYVSAFTLADAAFAVGATAAGDAFTSSAAPTANFGAAASLRVTGPGIDERILIRFDLGALPATTTGNEIAKATLRVWVSEVGTRGELVVRPVLGPWNEATVTHDTAPPLGDAIATGAVTTSRRFVSLDITVLVREWVDQTVPNRGVVLVAGAAGLAATFDSKENQATSHEPALDIVLSGVAGVTGDITRITAGPGLTGGGTSGPVTVAIAPSHRLPQACGTNQVPKADGADGWRCADIALPHVTFAGDNAAFGRNALVNNTAGRSNTASGDQTLASNTTGDFNTAVGARALNRNTLGSDNTAGGNNALRDNTTGRDNTATGSHALQSNTTGTHNTASGAKSLMDNTTGSDNTASGAGALRLNTIGTENTASGADALGNNTTGTRNTATGVAALFTNTGGRHNTASGYAALRSNTTGNFNTASGENALRSNTTANHNTATGAGTLRRNTTGTDNTATGVDALFNNETGDANTASGYSALFSNTIGSQSAAHGNFALFANTTGHSNTATGYRALAANTAGAFNTASGHSALHKTTTGSRNIAIGVLAGGNQTTGNGNIYLGHAGVAGESNTIHVGSSTHERTFVAGIRGVTTGVADAIAVVIDRHGQLGTVSSTRRVKEAIEDMGAASAAVLKLRPVTFQYIVPSADGGKPRQYGLIAEEVAAVFPQLVAYDRDGRPETVFYQVLPVLLLNELQRQQRQLDELTTRLREMRDEMEALRASPR